MCVQKAKVEIGLIIPLLTGSYSHRHRGFSCVRIRRRFVRFVHHSHIEPVTTY